MIEKRIIIIINIINIEIKFNKIILFNKIKLFDWKSNILFILIKLIISSIKSYI